MPESTDDQSTAVCALSSNIGENQTLEQLHESVDLKVLPNQNLGYDEDNARN